MWYKVTTVYLLLPLSSFSKYSSHMKVIWPLLTASTTCSLYCIRRVWIFNGQYESLICISLHFIVNVMKQAYPWVHPGEMAPRRTAFEMQMPIHRSFIWILSIAWSSTDMAESTIAWTVICGKDFFLCNRQQKKVLTLFPWTLWSPCLSAICRQEDLPLRKEMRVGLVWKDLMSI